MGRERMELGNQELIAAVDKVIADRRTIKVFADPDSPPAIPDGLLEGVEQSMVVSGMAPFHYACHATYRGEGGAIEPWRFHLLDAEACRAMIARIRLEASRSEEQIWRDAPSRKIPRMLAAAGAMILLTWLPDPPMADDDGHRIAEREKRNREHLAAAAAAGQNLLLASTARGLASYWSSGGVLATERALSICGVPAGQELLGALFFFAEPGPEESHVTGKLREQRGPADRWSRRVVAETIASAEA